MVLIGPVELSLCGNVVHVGIVGDSGCSDVDDLLEGSVVVSCCVLKFLSAVPVGSAPTVTSASSLPVGGWESTALSVAVAGGSGSVRLWPDVDEGKSLLTSGGTASSPAGHVTPAPISMALGRGVLFCCTTTGGPASSVGMVSVTAFRASMSTCLSLIECVSKECEEECVDTIVYSYDGAS